MSSDAGLLVRRCAGPALSARQTAKVLGLPSDPSEVMWQSATGPDGSLFKIRLSTERGDRLGPAVGEPLGDWLAEREYDCFLHICISRTAGDDSMAALRAYCRFAVARLHTTWTGLETTFDLDYDDTHGYRVDLPNPGQAQIDVWLATNEQPSPGSFSLTAAADRAAMPISPPFTFITDRTDQRLTSADEAGDSVTEALAIRSRELEHLSAARALAPSLTSTELNNFTERLLRETAEAHHEVAIAIWVNGLLHCFESHLRPLN